MQGVIEGRIVHYVLTPEDAEQINRRRMVGNVSEDWQVGAQAHVGNSVEPGEHVPMMIVKVWNDEDGYCNGQALLDGNDSLWVTSTFNDEGRRPGTWHWIERA